MNIKSIAKKIVTIKLFMLSIGVIALIMLGAYFIYFGLYLHRSFGNVEDWGNFGSYFGSITGLLAFLGVLYSLMESKKETISAKLEADRREVKTTEQAVKREEMNLFFRLLELHKEQFKNVTYTEVIERDNLDDKIIIYKDIKAFEMYAFYLNSILVEYAINDCILKMEIKELDGILNSKDVFKKYFTDNYISDKCKKIISRLPKSIKDKSTLIQCDDIKRIINDRIELNSFYKGVSLDKYNSNLISDIYFNYGLKPTYLDIYKALRLAGNVLNKIFGHILGQYVRNLCYILITCDKFQIFEKFDFDQFYYFNLYKAQLSRTEVLLLLSLAMSDKSNLRFIELLDKYKMLDELYYDDFFYIKNKKLWEGKERDLVKGVLKCAIEEFTIKVEIEK